MSEMLDKLSETVGELCKEYGRQLLELRQERDQLRAELAAAKEHLGIAINNAAGWRKRTAERRQKMKELAAHVERLEGALKGVCKLRKKTEATHQAAYEAMFKLPGRKVFEDAADALAATPAQSPETNGEQDFWARMQGPLVHCPNTASTSTGSSAAIELHAKQWREALETLNHAAKVAISSLYGSSFDEDTPLVIRLLDGTCDATDTALAATPADSLAAHDAEVKVAVLDQIKALLYSLASKEQDQPYGYDMNPRQWAATCLECAAEDVTAMQDEIISEADRIEKEAANG